jgi:hypothetical protein
MAAKNLFKIKAIITSYWNYFFLTKDQKQKKGKIVLFGLFMVVF